MEPQNDARCAVCYVKHRPGETCQDAIIRAMRVLATQMGKLVDTLAVLNANVAPPAPAARPPAPHLVDSAPPDPDWDKLTNAPVVIAEPRNINNTATHTSQGGSGPQRPPQEHTANAAPTLDQRVMRSPQTITEFRQVRDGYRKPEPERPTGTASQNQVNAIYAALRARKRLSESQAIDATIERYGVGPYDLTSKEASEWLSLINGGRA